MTTENMNTDVLAAVRANLPELHVEWLSEKLNELGAAEDRIADLQSELDEYAELLGERERELQELRAVDRRIEDLDTREQMVADREADVAVQDRILEVKDAERDRHVEIALEAMRLVTRNEHVRRTRFIVTDDGHSNASHGDTPQYFGTSAEEVTETDEIV